MGIRVAKNVHTRFSRIRLVWNFFGAALLNRKWGKASGSKGRVLKTMLLRKSNDKIKRGTRNEMKKSFQSRTAKGLAAMVATLLLLAISAVSAFGQVTGGAVTGTVLDSNGGAVVGATVLLHDKTRGQDLTAETTSAGSYSFPNVQTGTYTMTVTATGFAKSVGDVVVSLNQTATANVALTVAGATAVVNVTSENGSIVQTDTSQVGETFKERQFLDLPVAGNPNNLALLAPNVSAPPTGVSGAGAVTGGLRQRLNAFTVDGVDNNNVGVSGNVRAVIQDSVSEFSFLQNNFNAEFSSGGAGSFNTITKSGTNQYHGSAFTYIGSQKLNSRSTDEDPDKRLTKRLFKDARYGGTVGGPLPFPHFGEGGPVVYSGKDKLFFFAAFEKNFFKAEGAANGYIAPTAAGLAKIATLPGASPFVIGLLQKAMPLASNQFDNCDPVNGTGAILGACGIGEGNVNVSLPNTNTTHSFQLNIDHNLNAKNQFRYRFYKTKFSSLDPVLVPLFASNTSLDQTSFSANWISDLSPNLINDARFGYIKSATLFNQLADQSQFNFPVLDLDAFGITLGPADQQTDSKKTFQFYDSVTWIRGGHTFKFGGEYLNRPNSIFFLPRHGGEYEYGHLDDFFRDIKPGDFNHIGIGDPVQPLASHQFGGFVQDDWKIKHNLTLNLGVRYDYQSIYEVEKLQAASANGNIPGVITFGVPKADKNNFAPRAGFAWAPSSSHGILGWLFGNEGDSSIRANYARSYVLAFSNLVSAGPPAALQGELVDAGPATNFLQQGGASPGPYVFNNSAANIQAVTGSLILDHVSPYADAFAVSFQRQLNRSTGIEVRYLRTYGRKLFVQVQTNSQTVADGAMVIPTLYALPTAAALGALPTIATVVAGDPILKGATIAPRQLPQFAGVLTSDPNIGKSKYDGLSFSLNRRFTSHFGATAAYTRSRTRDNSFNELFTSSLNPRRPQDAGEYFGSGLDLSQDYSLSIVDVPNRFVASWVYEVPFKSSNSFVNAIAGGWEITGIFQAQSGQLVDFQSGIDSNRNGDNAGDRVFLNPNGDRSVGSGVVGLFLDAGGNVKGVNLGGSVITNVRAYAPGVADANGNVTLHANAGWVQAGYFAAGLANGGAGLAPRNDFRTKGYNSTDMDFIKNTRFGKEGRYNFQIAAEVHDVLNQRPQTVAGFGGSIITGARSFVEPSQGSLFLNYSPGVFGGRTVTMRAKFIF
jgi:outer membrane receptor protein involved in Fe transport